MRCVECNQPFKPTRANVKLCSKCMLGWNRRLRPHTVDPEMLRDVEAKRLVAEYALLRPGTQPYEITATRLREIGSVIAASTRL
jgi:hypothetical protein